MLPNVEGMSPESIRAAYGAYLESTQQLVDSRFKEHNRQDLQYQFGYLTADLAGIERAIDDWSHGRPEDIGTEDAAMLGRIASLRTIASIR